MLFDRSVVKLPSSSSQGYTDKHFNFTINIKQFFKSNSYISLLYIVLAAPPQAFRDYIRMDKAAEKQPKTTQRLNPELKQPKSSLMQSFSIKVNSIGSVVIEILSLHKKSYYFILQIKLKLKDYQVFSKMYTIDGVGKFSCGKVFFFAAKYH